MLKQLKNIWLNLTRPQSDFSNLSKEDLQSAMLAIKGKLSEIEKSNPLSDAQFRWDMYFTAVLTGLIARAGTIGGPENNHALIHYARQHADALLKGE